MLSTRSHINKPSASMPSWDQASHYVEHQVTQSSHQQACPPGTRQAIMLSTRSHIIKPSASMPPWDQASHYVEHQVTHMLPHI
eukprot:1157108-Pelagomonas_calceolata.AAC.14